MSITFGGLLRIFGASMALYLVVINLISLLLSLSFGTFEKNFNQQSLFFDNFQNILDVCIYGGFFLAHYYYQKSRKDGEQLAQYNRALVESKVAQLKAQLNPHFLFNNLNVLDQLIEEDKRKASDFLNDFADLYRYLLQTSDSKLVNLEEELDFSLNYFRLMQHRYDEGYLLEVKREESSGGFLPPLALQLLLENAFQHNIGSKQAPVCITIAIGSKLTVTNNVIAKPTSKPFGGRGLQNLKEQYALLSQESVDITLIDGHFSVSLPLIPYAKP
jgi:Putative regulator of cell autolysis